MESNRWPLAADGPAGNLASSASSMHPPSAMKKSSASRTSALPRASMAAHPYAPSSSSHPRQSIAAGASLGQKRQSMAPAARIGSSQYASSGARGDAGIYGRTPQASRALGSQTRRSSIFASAGGGRASMAPSYGATVTKDPRQVRSAAFQNECVRAVTTYLSQHKVQHALSRQNGPTQRDFQMLFRFLADQLLGPAYPWNGKKFEEDCIAILRDLQYPGFDSVGRTMLSAPGSSTHWPSVLAMLAWMVELCSAQEAWGDVNIVSDTLACPASELPLDHPQKEDRLLWEFASKAYVDWFENLADDLSGAERELEEDFAQMAAASVEECNQLETVLNEKRTALRQLAAREPLLKKVEEECSHFMSDKAKFHSFIENQRLKAHKLRQQNAKGREAIPEQAKAIAAARIELSETEAAVAAQNLSPDEVSRMNHDRENLNRQLEELRAKVTEAAQLASEQEMRVTKSMDRFDQQLQDYTALSHKIGTMAYLPGQGLPGFVEIDYSVDVDLGAEDLNTIHQYGQSKFQAIRPALKSFADGLRTQVAGLQNDVISLEDKHERLGQDVERQREEVADRQQQYNIVHEKGEEEKNQLHIHTSMTNAAISALEAEIASKSTQQGSVLTAQSNLESARVTFERVRQKTQQLHESLVDEVMTHVDAMVQAKAHTETSLQAVLVFAEAQD